LNQVTLLFFPTYLYKQPNVSYNIPPGTVAVLYLKCNRTLLSLTKLPKYQFSKQLQFRQGTTESIFSSSRWKQVFAFLFIVKPSDENNCKIMRGRLLFVACKFLWKTSKFWVEIVVIIAIYYLLFFTRLHRICRICSYEQTDDSQLTCHSIGPLSL
jgi:hypothetical protein